MAKYGKLTWDETEAVINKLGGVDAVRRFLSGELVIKAAELLKPLVTVTTRALAKFSAQDTFGAKNPAVKIGYLGDNFKKHFLDKIENDISVATLIASTLIKDSLDAPILAELGERAEISLAHVWELLTKQASGEKGLLLTDGSWNIFYVRGTDGNLWAVDARWCARGGVWYVFADSVVSPHRWCAGHRVVSRQ